MQVIGTPQTERRGRNPRTRATLPAMRTRGIPIGRSRGTDPEPIAERGPANARAPKNSGSASTINELSTTRKESAPVDLHRGAPSGMRTRRQTLPDQMPGGV
jgi:hypothetical protein